MAPSPSGKAHFTFPWLDRVWVEVKAEQQRLPHNVCSLILFHGSMGNKSEMCLRIKIARIKTVLIKWSYIKDIYCYIT